MVREKIYPYMNLLIAAITLFFQLFNLHWFFFKFRFSLFLTWTITNYLSDSTIYHFHFILQVERIFFPKHCVYSSPLFQRVLETLWSASAYLLGLTTFICYHKYYGLAPPDCSVSSSQHRVYDWNVPNIISYYRFFIIN